MPVRGRAVSLKLPSLPGGVAGGRGGSFLFSSSPLLPIFYGFNHPRPVPLIQVKNFFQFTRYRAAIRVCRHDVLHIRPPAAAGVRFGNCLPLCLRLDLRVCKKAVRLVIEKNRIIANAVTFQNLSKIFPQFVVPANIFFAAARVDRHQKRLAYHFSFVSSTCTELSFISNLRFFRRVSTSAPASSAGP
jgi:hypothetical protein